MTASNDRPIETPQQWLRYAEGDLLVAEHEMQMPSPVYHTVCFLCQSASEKFWKGFLISQGWLLEKTHDLVELLAWCTDYDAQLAGMVAEGALLNEYIVPDATRATPPRNRSGTLKQERPWRSLRESEPKFVGR